MGFDYEDELEGAVRGGRVQGNAGQPGQRRQTEGAGQPARADRPVRAAEASGSGRSVRAADMSGMNRAVRAAEASGSGRSVRAADMSGTERSVYAAEASGSGRSVRAADVSGTERSVYAADAAGSGRPVRPSGVFADQGYEEERRIKTRRQQPETESFSSKVAQIRQDLNRKKKRRRRIIALVLAECIALAGIFSYAYVKRLYNLMPKPSVSKENVENPNISVDAITKMQGYWMIAIFGIDAGTGTSSSRGNSSDVNMIACINQDTGEIKLVSLYRDTYLKVNDRGTYRKFNYAYSEGGPEQALKMLNENLDLNITEYIIFNWKAVADGINILGGVDMEITNSEFKFINAFITETVEETGVASRHLQSAGMNHLDGIQAVAYGRLRLMDSDYKRVERQKKVIEQAFAKAKQAEYSVLNNILVVCLQEVMTNLDFVDLTNAALNVTKYHIGETAGFPFQLSEANLGKARGACIIPQTLTSNVSQLHQFLFGDEAYEPTDAVKAISAKISEDSGVYAVQNKPSTTAASSETKASSSSGNSSSGSGDSSSGGQETDETSAGNESETDDTGMIIAPGPDISETDENGEPVNGSEPGGPGTGGLGPGSYPGNGPGSGNGASAGPGSGNGTSTGPGSVNSGGNGESNPAGGPYGPGDMPGTGSTTPGGDPSGDETAASGNTGAQGGETSSGSGNGTGPGVIGPGGSTSAGSGDSGSGSGSPSGTGNSGSGNGGPESGNNSPAGSGNGGPGGSPAGSGNGGPGSSGPGDADDTGIIIDSVPTSQG